MSLFDAVSGFIAEMTAYCIGKLIGNHFKMDRKKAQRIGENIVIVLLISAGVIITIVYS